MLNKMPKITAAFIVIVLVIVSISLLSCNSKTDISKGEMETTVEAGSSSSETQQETTAVKDETLTADQTSAVTEAETTEEVTETIKNGEVTFLTEDGIELNGNVFGQGKKWVILSHMYPTDQTSWFDFARDLAQKGYTALTFDFRGYGKSKGDKEDIPNIDKDIKAAISFVRQYDYEKLFLVGASMGGTVSIVVAAEDTAISGVVSLASPDKMGNDFDALSVVSKLKMPKIFISAKGDDYHAESANRLYENAVEPKAIEIIENSKEHGTFIFENEPENAQILKDLIINFLNSN
ncbi:MAG: alpha/beta fold hydrolase [Actinobacteria bacterium]|nr:alpha/beta fold hydrolase [Actinomycetota bacterium]